ncbi:hypothetical protein D9M69_530120 [compost metagenome]
MDLAGADHCGRRRLVPGGARLDGGGPHGHHQFPDRRRAGGRQDASALQGGQRRPRRACGPQSRPHRRHRDDPRRQGREQPAAGRHPVLGGAAPADPERRVRPGHLAVRGLRRRGSGQPERQGRRAPRRQVRLRRPGDPPRSHAGPRGQALYAEGPRPGVAGRRIARVLPAHSGGAGGGLPPGQHRPGCRRAGFHRCAQ